MESVIDKLLYMSTSSVALYIILYYVAYTSTLYTQKYVYIYNIPEYISVA